MIFRAIILSDFSSDVSPEVAQWFKEVDSDGQVSNE